jgi:hypothetical protein
MPGCKLNLSCQIYEDFLGENRRQSLLTMAKSVEVHDLMVKSKDAQGLKGRRKLELRLRTGSSVLMLRALRGWRG